MDESNWPLKVEIGKEKGLGIPKNGLLILFYYLRVLYLIRYEKEKRLLMIEKQVSVHLLYQLNNLHHVVVQQAHVTQDHIYALQLLHKQTETIIYRSERDGRQVDFVEDQPLFYLHGVKANGKAGGHTQTWEPAGKRGFWFVGTKPKRYGHNYWTTQIARLHEPADVTLTFMQNTELPRLSYLNRAGSGFDNNSVVYPGKEMERLEAAVTPDHKRLMIASIGFDHRGHFALYDLSDINQALDQVEDAPTDINIEQFKCLGAFMIPHFNTDPLTSVQGYELDNQNNIYVSSQSGPTTNWLGMAKQGRPREIVKIPWGCPDPQKWEVAQLDKEHHLNVFGYVTEFEGMQVLSPNKIYLTVAYHRKDNSLTTLGNRIYEIDGFDD